MKVRIRVLGLLVLLLALPLVHSQEKEDPAHQQLRALLQEVLQAYNANDVDKLIGHLDDNVVVTWQNGKVNKGPAEVKAFFEEMTKGPNKVVEKSVIKPVPDALSLLYNDGKTAVAYGSSKDYYKLNDGLEFDQDTRWSATLIKKGDGWKVASIHISANIFDNPVLDIVKRKTAQGVGTIAGVGGFIAGLAIGWLGMRKSTKGY